jgi:hypothetical protein
MRPTHPAAQPLPLSMATPPRRCATGEAGRELDRDPAGVVPRPARARDDALSAPATVEDAEPRCAQVPTEPPINSDTSGDPPGPDFHQVRDPFSSPSARGLPLEDMFTGQSDGGWCAA